MIKKTLAALLLLMTGTGTRLIAQDYKFGVGLRLSNDAPSISNSVTARYRMDENQALEGMISFGSRFGVGVLYENFRPLGSGFKWFYGGGAYIGFQGGDAYLGPTGIIGLDYKFTEAPINISLDWKPELDVIPKVNLIPDAFGLSIRYAF